MLTEFENTFQMLTPSSWPQIVGKSKEMAHEWKDNRHQQQHSQSNKLNFVSNFAPFPEMLCRTHATLLDLINKTIKL